MSRPPDWVAQVLTSGAFGCGVLLFVFLLLLSTVLPGFLPAQTRALVARTHGELRSLQTSILDYRALLVEKGGPDVFPPMGEIHQEGWLPWTEKTYFGGPNSPGNGVHACSVLWVAGSFFEDAGDRRPSDAAPVPGGTVHYDLRVMTSPIEAISSFPSDPFKPGDSNTAQYDYFLIDSGETFCLRSLGPDADADIGCGSDGFDCACAEPCRSATGEVGSEFGVGFATLAKSLHEGPGVYCPTNGTESSGDIWQSSIPEVMQPLGD